MTRRVVIEARHCEREECSKLFTPRQRNGRFCSPECQKISHSASRGARGRAARSKSAQRKHDAKRRTKGIKAKTYAAFDGEGMTQTIQPDPENPFETFENHGYTYMAMADTTGAVEELEVKPFEERRRIRTEQALWFMWRNGKGKSCWFFSSKYDWTHILRDVPHKILHQLLHADSNPDGTLRDPFTPVRWKGWGFVYVQGTMKLTRHWKDKETGKEVSVAVNFQDAFKCFGGGSFVATLNAWEVGTVEQRERIAEMKDKRAHFERLDDEVRGYCIEEVQLLAELAQKVVGIFADMDIRPRSGVWYSAGSAAKALLRVHRINADPDNDWDGYRGPDRYAGAPDDIKDVLMRTLFGGWFENSETGLFEVLYSEDYKSAYPAVIKNLPCTAHGHWERRYVEGAVNFGHVRWELSDPEADMRWAPFVWRWPSGSIYRPTMGQGWYCEAEVTSAKQLPGYDFEDLGWIAFVPECDHRPFDWVQEVYDLRVELGSDGRGLALKVTLNSIYGTFADTLSLDSKYANIVWASMITGGTRAKILDEIAVRGDEIVSVATDGILSTVKSPKARKTKVLGELNYEGPIEDVLLIQPGLYLAASGADPKKTLRNRGHGMKDMRAIEDQLRAAWVAEGWSAAVTYERTRFIPAKLALARANPYSVYGQWVTDPVTVKFTPTNRVKSADPGPRKRSFAGLRHPFVLDRETGEPLEESAPYDKLVSIERNRAMIDARELEEAQP